ncbi:MAG: outer membrane beta-barrel protein [Planctomycetota bacterium]|nr:outer membrane beta-barrel protein [Planctomycetota bacterium]
MRSILRTAVVVAASLLLVPQFVAAADLSSEIQDMKQRLEAMEGQLQTQNADLTDARAMVAAQQVQIDQTETLVNDEREATSALSSFLESTDISGFVAAGWNYVDTNTDVDNDETDGFNLDQAWITINKAATAESRAGFNLEFQMGELAQEGVGFGNSDVIGIYAASVSYLAPVGNGLMVDAGILSTALGAEVEAQNGNWQITRGAVFGLQPITNTGVTATYNLTDNISVMAGALNNALATDRNNAGDTLGLTSQVSYSQDKFGLNVGYNYGSGGFNGDYREGLLDVVATLDLTDNLSVWANYDYSSREQTNGGATASTNGIAIAGRLGVMEGTGISGRFEYVSGDGYDGGGLVVADQDLMTYTVTVDRAITAGLTGKFEYRYNSNDLAGGNSSSVIATQLLYQF